MIKIRALTDDNAKTQQLLQRVQKESITKIVPFNSVAFIEVQLPQSNSSLVHIGCDMFVEQNNAQVIEILKRKQAILDLNKQRIKEVHYPIQNEEVSVTQEIPKELEEPIDIQEDFKEIKEKEKEQQDKSQLELMKQMQLAFMNEDYDTYNQLQKQCSNSQQPTPIIAESKTEVPNEDKQTTKKKVGFEEPAKQEVKRISRFKAERMQENCSKK